MRLSVGSLRAMQAGGGQAWRCPLGGLSEALGRGGNTSGTEKTTAEVR